MTTRTASVTGRRPVDQAFPGESSLITWADLQNGDDGEAVQFGAFTDRSIQFGGTFGAGGTIVLEGSNDGVNYLPLTDPQGNPITLLDLNVDGRAWAKLETSARSATSL